jgi:tetratricopeptide (TPR) repeat protein
VAVQELLKRAAASFNRGDLRHARSEAEAALAAQPDSAAALQFLGVICCQSGDPDRGADYLKRALRSEPANAGARLNLAKALLDLGRLDEAAKVSAHGQWKGEVPADAWRLQGDILKAQSRPAEGAQAYRRVVQAAPNDFQAWNNLGTTLLEAGDAEGAIEALGRARGLRPGEAIIHLNLGRALAAAERNEDSVAAFKVAVGLTPGDASYHLELGRALNRVGRNQEALPVLAAAARLDQRNPATYVALGLTFASMGEFGRAEEGYRVALHVDPRHADAYLNLGILLEQANSIDKLEDLLEQAQANMVAGDEIDFLRALLLRRQGELEEALGLAGRTSTKVIDPVLRGHLIGQLADRLDDPETAFSAFEEMNRATARDPSAIGFDGTEHWRFVDGLREITTNAWYDSWPVVEVDPVPPSPVFLVGFPRSGTTLLDTILMSHPATHVLEEEPVLGRVRDQLGGIEPLAETRQTDVDALRKRYFEELEAISPTPPGKLVIDKLPLNILRAPLAHRIFPDAKFIFAQRHPCDVVLSCFMQNFKINQAMASFLTLQNAALLYDRVLSYWEQCREVFPLRVHTLRYEAMVADLESEVRPLIEFLGLAWDDAILDYRKTAADRDYIRTPSYSQVTEKIYARARGRWERYRKQMAPVLPILEPWAVKLGYGSLDEAAASARNG